MRSTELEVRSEKYEVRKKHQGTEAHINLRFTIYDLRFTIYDEIMNYEL